MPEAYPVAVLPDSSPQVPAEPVIPVPDTVPPEDQPVRIRRSDRWKEDLGE